MDRREFLISLGILGVSASFSLSGCKAKISLEDARQDISKRQDHLDQFLSLLRPSVKKIFYLGVSSNKNLFAESQLFKGRSLDDNLNQMAALEHIVNREDLSDFRGEIMAYSDIYEAKNDQGEYIINNGFDITSVLMHEKFHIDLLKTRDEVLRYYAKVSLDTDDFSHFEAYSEMKAYFGEVSFVFDNREYLVSRPYLRNLTTSYLWYYTQFVLKSNLDMVDKDYASHTVVETFHPILHGLMLQDNRLVREIDGKPMFLNGLSDGGEYIELPMEIKDSPQYQDLKYKYPTGSHIA